MRSLRSPYTICLSTECLDTSQVTEIVHEFADVTFDENSSNCAQSFFIYRTPKNFNRGSVDEFFLLALLYWGWIA